MEIRIDAETKVPLGHCGSATTLWEKLTKTDGRGLSFLKGSAPMALIDEQMTKKYGHPLGNTLWTRENALAEVDGLISVLLKQINGNEASSESD